MSRGLDVERLAVVAREDARDAVRERQAHVLGALFVLVGGGIAYAAGRSAGRSPPDATVELVPGLIGPLAMLVPLIALGVVSGSIVEKRTGGALTVLLGLPLSRRVVVLGTLLGRYLVLCAAVLSAVLVAVPIALAMGVAVDPVHVVLGTLALLVLTATFTAFAVAISAIARTSTRATFAAFGVYVLFVFRLWGQLPRLVVYVANGLSYPEEFPSWVAFVAALNPLTAFTNALVGISPSLAEGTIAPAPSDPAVYERPAFAVAVLVAWAVGTVGLGYYRFRTTDV